jgi:hypothetical protein
VQKGGGCLDRFIQVVFTDGTLGQMVPAALNICLRQNRIRSFKRVSGWVTVGFDSIRGVGSGDGYAGPERRRVSLVEQRRSMRLS